MYRPKLTPFFVDFFAAFFAPFFALFLLFFGDQAIFENSPTTPLTAHHSLHNARRSNTNRQPIRTP
jgi:hypothetical protein